MAITCCLLANSLCFTWALLCQLIGNYLCFTCLLLVLYLCFTCQSALPTCFPEPAQADSLFTFWWHAHLLYVCLSVCMCVCLYVQRSECERLKHRSTSICMYTGTKPCVSVCLQIKARETKAHNHLRKEAVPAEIHPPLLLSYFTTILLLFYYYFATTTHQSAGD
jgi:hypothetical protein